MLALNAVLVFVDIIFGFYYLTHGNTPLAAWFAFLAVGSFIAFKLEKRYLS